jgi:hypothetical protein
MEALNQGGEAKKTEREREKRRFEASKPNSCHILSPHSSEVRFLSLEKITPYLSH